MARFKRERSEARSVMLSFRAAPSEVAYLRGLAEERGLSLADLLREAIDEFIRHQERRKRT